MFYKLFHKLFGFEYVMVKDSSLYVVKRARRFGRNWFIVDLCGKHALLADGRLDGLSYFHKWSPLTEVMNDWYITGRHTV